MHGTIPPGRIAGVRVGLHWSVAGIVVVVAAGLAAYQLPAVYPGHSRIAYAVAGVAASGLLVCSLLGHELAHAVVARRNGVAVEGITLWLLGGVARLRDEARSPGADLRIATVGPTASAALAVAFGALAWTSNLAGAGELVIAVLGYLALLNVLLALFNLLPAAPWTAVECCGRRSGDGAGTGTEPPCGRHAPDSVSATSWSSAGSCNWSSSRPVDCGGCCSACSSPPRPSQRNDGREPAPHSLASACAT
ncbi:site-2 protease family protein [Saccharopolyspora spinosporotrichia]